MTHDHQTETLSGSAEDRRNFLKSCGRFAAVTPPAITMLLSTSLTSEAIAKSFCRRPWNKGWQHGDYPRPPGNRFQDKSDDFSDKSNKKRKTPKKLAYDD